MGLEQKLGKKFMSLTDNFCSSLETKDDQKLCCRFHGDLLDILADLDKKGYLRSDLGIKQGEEKRIYSENVITNVREITDAFNKFSSMYTNKKRQKKFLELNKPYGMTKRNLNYLFYSQSVFVFLQNIEAFRTFLLFIMKLPINYQLRGKSKEIKSKTTLGILFEKLKELEIKKADTLGDIDYKLRNGLSHCLFWLHEQGDSECPKPHLHYSEDITFKNTKQIPFDKLLSKTREQAIYTLCLWFVIVNWFYFAQ